MMVMVMMMMVMIRMKIMINLISQRGDSGRKKATSKKRAEGSNVTLVMKTLWWFVKKNIWAHEINVALWECKWHYKRMDDLKQQSWTDVWTIFELIFDIDKRGFQKRIYRIHSERGIPLPLVCGIILEPKTFMDQGGTPLPHLQTKIGIFLPHPSFFCSKNTGFGVCGLGRYPAPTPTIRLRILLAEKSLWIWGVPLPP